MDIGVVGEGMIVGVGGREGMIVGVGGGGGGRV